MSHVSISARNWALYRPIEQSSYYNATRFPPDSAVDGLTDSGKFTHTSSLNVNAGHTWWLVYLEKPIFIGKVVIYNRCDGNYPSRLSYMDIIIFDQNDRLQNRRLCGTLPNMNARSYFEKTCSPALYGQGVEIGKGGNHIISVTEVEVYELDG